MGCIRTPIWRRSYTLVASSLVIALGAGTTFLVVSWSDEPVVAEAFEAPASAPLAVVPRVQSELREVPTPEAPTVVATPIAASSPDAEAQPAAENTAPDATRVGARRRDRRGDYRRRLGCRYLA